MRRLPAAETAAAMTAYYDEWDPWRAAVLRWHVAAGRLPAGKVDARDGNQVPDDDWRGYTQWHLFAGIGGIPLGLRWAGWPDDAPILTAGFPCQPVSLAGRHLGPDDPRWGWPVVARVLRVVRPPVVLLENVPGLLRWGLDTVLGDLAQSGYDAAWRVFAAADVGAPHRRDRLWLVAYPAEPGLPGGADPTPAGASFPGADRRGRRTVAPGLGGSAHGLPAGMDRPAGWPAPRRAGVPPGAVVPPGVRVRDRTARLAALGDAVVPAVVADRVVPWMREVLA